MGGEQDANLRAQGRMGTLHQTKQNDIKARHPITNYFIARVASVWRAL